MIEFAAFVATVAQLVCFALKRMNAGWMLCIVACVLWALVAVERSMPWLLTQQILIACIACGAFANLRGK